MDYSETRAFLANANIIRLQGAARMAGLRWKSGDPAYNKAGLIDKLMEHPSICRACVAQLERGGKDGFAVAKTIDFAADIADENTSPALAPVTVVATPQIIPQDQNDTLWAFVRSLAADLARNTDADQNDEAALRVTRRAVQDMQNDLVSLGTAVNAMQEQRPIQFNFPSREPITIDPKGHHKSFVKLVKYLQLNRRVILCGAAGTGKSIAVKNAAKTLGVPFYVLPPVTMGHELIGHRDAQGVFHETPLTMAYKNGGLCLLDESDASLPDALLVANPILDGNGFAMLGDGKMHEQHPDFLAVFNMNTDGNGATMQYSGRNRLDGATLARFGVRIQWDIDPTIETVMALGRKDWLATIRAIRAFMEQREIVDVNATPRHLKTGAMLLASGCPRLEVLTDCLQSGALGAAWPEVLRLPEVRSFLQGV